MKDRRKQTSSFLPPFFPHLPFIKLYESLFSLKIFSSSYAVTALDILRGNPH